MVPTQRKGTGVRQCDPTRRGLDGGRDGRINLAFAASLPPSTPRMGHPQSPSALTATSPTGRPSNAAMASSTQSQRYSAEALSVSR